MQCDSALDSTSQTGSCFYTDSARRAAGGKRAIWLDAERADYEILKVYKDHGISGAKGRDKRPAFDALHRDGAER